MSHKAKSSAGVVTLAVFVLLFAYNNCQPMQPISTLDVSSTGTPQGGDGGAAAEASFTSTVLPRLRLQCSNCHVSKPIDVGSGGVFAPDRIYNYAFLRGMGLQGTSAVNNALYNKMRGITAHTGGDQCIGDVSGSVSPCREVKTWLLLENPLFADGMAGAVSYVSSVGQVVGYALDPKAPSLAINIVVYVNGPVGLGTLVGTYPANLPGSGLASGHSFSFMLPAEARDGTSRSLYIYGQTAVVANLLPNSPTNYTAYTPSVEGREIFENNLRGRLVTACAGCHTWTYEGAYERLSSPLAGAGGSATNNVLINKASGMNHSGGVRCPGGKNAEPCATMQAWWQAEFN